MAAPAHQDVRRIRALDHGPDGQPGVDAVGRSFKLWTATSMERSRSACSSSAVKTPLPPITGSGVSRILSPVVRDHDDLALEIRALPLQQLAARVRPARVPGASPACRYGPSGSTAAAFPRHPSG